ncbi:MAG TPA: hypothetical protein VN843_14100, partial [Anaerolineales bacterium]|nr:hypothetical protein [Anaerolineales bacterium]
DGWIFLYDCDCFHPVSGKRLLPVTPEVVDKHKAQNLLALAGFKKLESDRINEAVGRCVSEAEKNYDKTFVVTVPIKAIYKKDSASFVIMLGGKMARISNRVGVVLDRSALEAAGVWMLWELYHNQYELGVRSEAVVGHRYNDVHGIRILSIPSTIGRFGSYQLGIKLNDNDPTSWFDTASWPARTKIQRCQTVFFYVQT